MSRRSPVRVDRARRLALVARLMEFLAGDGCNAAESCRTGESQGWRFTIRHPMRARTEVKPAHPHAHAFAMGRARALASLERAGLSTRHAQAWIAAWDFASAGLDDFRQSSDFWELGREYALEERKRGYEPPDMSAIFDAREAS